MCQIPSHLPFPMSLWEIEREESVPEFVPPEVRFDDVGLPFHCSARWSYFDHRWVALDFVKSFTPDQTGASTEVRGAFTRRGSNGSLGLRFAETGGGGEGTQVVTNTRYSGIIMWGSLLLGQWTGYPERSPQGSQVLCHRLVSVLPAAHILQGMLNRHRALRFTAVIWDSPRDPSQASLLSALSEAPSEWPADPVFEQTTMVFMAEQSDGVAPDEPHPCQVSFTRDDIELNIDLVMEGAEDDKILNLPAARFRRLIATSKRNSKYPGTFHAEFHGCFVFGFYAPDTTKKRVFDQCMFAGRLVPSEDWEYFHESQKWAG
jgi:hypothetical protein